MSARVSIYTGYYTGRHRLNENVQDETSRLTLSLDLYAMLVRFEFSLRIHGWAGPCACGARAVHGLEIKFGRIGTACELFEQLGKMRVVGVCRWVGG